MIPIGERAVSWIEKYVVEVRPSLVVERDVHAEGGPQHVERAIHPRLPNVGQQ
jgi:site-specific recombinase XerD